MERMKWWKWAVPALIIVLVVTGLFMISELNRYQTDGEVRFQGLSAPGKVIRDEKGMPYIYARNLHDVIRIQGYVTAQDRLFQMHLTRLFAQGRISVITIQRENKRNAINAAVTAGLDADDVTIGIGQQTGSRGFVVDIEIKQGQVVLGDRLLQPEAVEALRKRLLPLAAILTPNTQEAAILARMDAIHSPDDMREAARRLLDLGPRAILIKAGHLGGDTSDDLWYDGETFEILPSPRHDNRHTHGTGCTLSAAITAHLARGLQPLEAAREAKRYISGAIANARPLGAGIGPVNHLWEVKT